MVFERVEELREREDDGSWDTPDTMHAKCFFCEAVLIPYHTTFRSYESTASSL